MAVTAAVTPIRLVCANTLGAALRQADHGVNAQRTFRFRHTGNLQAKFAEARQVLGMTVNYQQRFKELADRMASEPIAEWALERRVLRCGRSTRTWARSPEQTAKGRSSGSSQSSEAVGAPARQRATAPGTKWVAFKAIAEHLDYGRRCTSRTNQVQRSFEDTATKQRALELVLAA
jgi:hypothetical protein